MNYQILLLLCIILLGYLGYKEIRKLNIKVDDIENKIKLEKELKVEHNANHKSHFEPIDNNKIVETTKNNIYSDKNDKIDDKFQFNESELTKELTRDFANFNYCSDSSIEQEDNGLDNDYDNGADNEEILN